MCLFIIYTRTLTRVANDEVCFALAHPSYLRTAAAVSLDYNRGDTQNKKKKEK